VTDASGPIYKRYVEGQERALAMGRIDRLGDVPPAGRQGPFEG